MSDSVAKESGSKRMRLSATPGREASFEAAATIMAGLASNPNVVGHNSQHGWGLVNCTDLELARTAVDMADALAQVWNEKHP